MAREALPALLAVAVERRYLDEVTAGKVAVECRRTGRGPETVLVERGILSDRRVERLQLHVRYKSLRKADKAYAKVALKAAAIDQAGLDGALDVQRRRFEDKRECLRLGAILIKQGKLSTELDRQLRARVAKLSASASGASGSAAATLMDDSASQGENRAEPSYALIDEAVSRVDAARKLREDLSESVKAKEQVCRDSAEDFEAACVLLARRRVGGGGVSKSTGALRVGA